MTPTSEQTSILSAVSDTAANLQIRALAGTGKTSTLELIEAASTVRPILCLAFNKKIAEEMSKRFSSTTTVRTFNSLGHRIWAKANASNLTLEPKKSQTILADIIKSLPRSRQGEAWASYWEVIHAVSLAKSLGYVPEGKYPNAKRLIERNAFYLALDEAPSDETADLIDDVLAASIKSAYSGLIDYNDQIYMCALFGGTFPRFPLILVDEAQDLSPTNHAMLDKLVRGRVISVGDPWQSIYGFRGAKQGGMAALKAKFEMTEHDLSVSFRCPQAVVEAARWRVPHFKWMKTGGHVEHLTQLGSAEIGENNTFICRNNAPLFRLALGLLSNGHSVSVAGSDIGPKIIGIMRKLGDDSDSRQRVNALIDDWLAERLAKESKTAADIADCMRVFASFGATLGQAISYAEHLFAQKGSIRLLTGHKAKGLEFDTVYHLDPWLCRDCEQDLNLRYVIITRAKDTLYEIDSRNIKW